MSFPTGTRIPLHHPNRTLVQEVIKEAAIHVIMNDLGNRVNGDCEGKAGSRKDMVGINSEGRFPDIMPHFELVGDMINTKIKRICKYADKRVDAAHDVVDRIISLPVNRRMATYLVAAAAIPKMVYGTQWAMPSKAKLRSLRAKAIRACWGASSKLRCPEIVLSLLHDPTRIDPIFACVTRAVLVARRMVR